MREEDLPGHKSNLMNMPSQSPTLSIIVKTFSCTFSEKYSKIKYSNNNVSQILLNLAKFII